MDPAILTLVFVAVGVGTLVFEVRGRPERIAVAAFLVVATPVVFWAFSSGWAWVFAGAAVVGWAVWCAARLVCDLLA